MFHHNKPVSGIATPSADREGRLHKEGIVRYQTRIGGGQGGATVEATVEILAIVPRLDEFADGVSPMLLLCGRVDR